MERYAKPLCVLSAVLALFSGVSCWQTAAAVRELRQARLELRAAAATLRQASTTRASEAPTSEPEQIVPPAPAFQTSEPEAATPPAELAEITASAETVYLSRTGTKYHRVDCATLKATPRPASRSEAEAMGREPCRVCRP